MKYLYKFVKVLNIEDENSDQYIFCDVSACKATHGIRSYRKALSYSNLKDLFKNALKPHVSDIYKFGLHSICSGGLQKQPIWV